MATIENTTSNTLLAGTSSDDSIFNGDWLGIDYSGGLKVTIKGETGSDRLCNDSNGSLSAIYGGDGADIINDAWASMMTLDGGNGADVIKNGADRVTITGVRATTKLSCTEMAEKLCSPTRAATVTILSSASMILRR